MVKILREDDRSPGAEVAKKHGLSERTIYVWRKRFSTMTADETKRLRALEKANNRLEKLVAERDLEIEVMKKIAAKEVGSGQQMAWLTVIDEYTREALAIDVAGSIRSSRVIEVLAKLISVHGAPRALKSDKGPEEWMR